MCSRFKNTMIYPTRHIRAAFLLLAFASLLVLLLASPSHATMAPGGARYKGGTIAAKGIVLGEKGKPIWAAYDDTGNFEKIGEAVDKLENAQVMSGNTYLGYVQAFLAVKAAHSAHSTILSREAYVGETTTFALAVLVYCYCCN